MIIITLQRAKCIGCGFCNEVAPEQFVMSEKDGKADLSEARERSGFHTSRTHDMTVLEANLKAEKGCPSKIIKVKIQ